MTEQLQAFCAVLLVIAGAVGIGLVFYVGIDVLTGGIKRISRERRCAMPKRIREGH